MALHWETYSGGPTRPENTVFAVTINNKHILTLNKYARKRLGEPEAVRLLFEKRESMIGLVPASPTDSMAFPLKPKGGGLNYVVHAAPFCRHFGIVIERTERFDEPLLDDQGILRLNLRKTRDVSNRRKRHVR
jgi:hypothetical protein